MTMNTQAQVLRKMVDLDIRDGLEFCRRVGQRLGPDSTLEERVKAFAAVERSRPELAAAYLRASAVAGTGAAQLTGDVAFLSAAAVLLKRRDPEDDRNATGTLELLAKVDMLDPELKVGVGAAIERIEKREAADSPGLPRARTADEILYDVRKADSGAIPWTELRVERDRVRLFGSEKLQALVAFRAGNLPISYVCFFGGRPVVETAVDWSGFDDSLRAHGLGSFAGLVGPAR